MTVSTLVDFHKLEFCKPRFLRNIRHKQRETDFWITVDIYLKALSHRSSK